MARAIEFDEKLTLAEALAFAEAYGSDRRREIR